MKMQCSTDPEIPKSSHVPMVIQRWWVPSCTHWGYLGSNKRWPKYSGPCDSCGRAPGSWLYMALFWPGRCGYMQNKAVYGRSLILSVSVSPCHFIFQILIFFHVSNKLIHIQEHKCICVCMDTHAHTHEDRYCMTVHSPADHHVLGLTGLGQAEAWKRALHLSLWCECQGSKQLGN